MELELKTNPKKIVGYHLKPGKSSGADWMEYPEKKMKLGVSSKYLEPNFTELFKEKWSSNEETNKDGFKLINNPFKLAMFEDFVSNKDIVNSIRHDFDEVKWYLRNMDLYEFAQSDDLKHIELPNIQLFYKFMKNEVSNWLKRTTGYELTDISATCSNYTCTDYLLAHDDRKDDRCLAFVYYLSPTEWNENDGGTLDLFDQEFRIIERIVPKNNRLILFPVSDKSFHQVSEVTSLDKARLSINGWFHVKDLNCGTNNPDVVDIFQTITKTDTDLSLWIAGNYLEGNYTDIQCQMEETSEISLQSFFKSEKLIEITECLYEIGEDKWLPMGPLTRKSYNVLKSDIPTILHDFLNLYRSDRFISLMKSYTDLDLTSSKIELQMWRCGDYELLGDPVPTKPELDVIVYFMDRDPDDVIGAKTNYIALEESVEEALTTVEPSLNSFNLIYRDTDRFTKYFSRKSRCEKFFRLFCTYRE